MHAPPIPFEEDAAPPRFETLAIDEIKRRRQLQPREDILDTAPSRR
jgi:hypothetical protein